VWEFNAKEGPCLNAAEIWNIIMQYSISAPEFLDPDDGSDRFPPWVIKNRHLLAFETYRKAECTRNALQRVCKSWHEFLCRYAHRFVRMCDVVHGKILAHYLKSAIRISFQGHNVSWCDRCQPELFLSDFLSQSPPGPSYDRLCKGIIEARAPFKVEIIDYSEMAQHILRNLNSSVIFPNVVSIYGTDESTPNIIESFPLLRYLNMGLDWFGGELLTLSSSTLTNMHLCYTIPNPSFTVFTDTSIQLPALRHLYIEGSEYEELYEYDEPAWVPLLKIVGKELKTLFFDKEQICTREDVLKDIWALCPKLEELSTINRCFLANSTPPPKGHPIHTLELHWLQITYKGTLELPDWPGLRTLRIHERWHEWEARKHGPLTSALIEWLKLRRIAFEDNVGESYTEYFTRIEPEGSPL
jgi:hypothetical protein